MQNAETRRLRADCKSRFGIRCWMLDVRCSGPLFYLLPLLPLLLRPRLNEQADAGDMAVRDATAGLLAAEENAEYRMQNAECTGPRPHCITPALQHSNTPLAFGDRTPLFSVSR